MRTIRSVSPVVLATTCLCLGTAAATEPSPTDSPINGLLQSEAANGTQAAVGFFVEEVCPQLLSAGFGGDGNAVGGTDGLTDRCTEIVVAGAGVTPSGVVSAQDGLQAMGAEEDSAIGGTDVDVGAGHKTNVEHRISALRVASLDGGGMAAGDVASGWGFFVNGLYVDSEKDTTSLETGFDLDGPGVTVGLDRRVTDSLILGGSFGYTNLDADLKRNSGKLDTDGYTFQIYGTYFTENYYLDGIAGYTRNDHDQARNLNYLISGLGGGVTVVDQVAFSSTNSDTYFFSFAAGGTFYHDKLAWGPYARFDYSRTDIDSYSETMSAPNAAGSSLAVRIDSQDFTSTTLALGLQAGYEFKLASGVVLYPQLSAEYVHEFENDNKPITGRFLTDVTGTQFRLPTDPPDRDYGQIGVGVVGDFGDGWFGHAQYQGLVGYSDLTVNAFEVGLRLEF